MKFLVDQMLGTLAKWLRLCGLDTFYADQEVSDDELLDIAEQEQRILITRDKELHQRAKKRNILSLITMSKSLSEQLDIVFQSFPSINEELQPLTRCSLCNSEIKSIDKEQIKEQIPNKVSQYHTLFWICPTCHQIYWKGSHYDKILHTIKQLQQKHKRQ